MNEDILNKVMKESNLELSPDEYEAAKEIFAKMESGDFSVLERVYTEDYEEIPVSIEEFLSEPQYFGNVTDRGRGVYPYWKDALSRVFSEESYCREVVLTGPIGSGKTSTAVLGIAYCFYRLLCLRNPQEFYALMSSSPIFFVFFSLTIDFVQDSSFAMLMEGMMKSPWFSARGEVRGRDYKRIEFPKKNVHIALGSKFVLGDGTLGKNVISGCFAPEETIMTASGGKVTFGEAYECGGVSLLGYLPVNKSVYIENAEIVLTKKEEDIYEVELEDGIVMRCTMDQRFLVETTTGELKEKALMDIDIETESIVRVNIDAEELNEDTVLSNWDSFDNRRMP